MSAVLGKPSLNRMDGRVVVITGGARGLGRTIALEVADKGATVVLLDLSETVVKTRDELRSQGASAHSYVVDITNSAEVDRVVEQVEQNVGPIASWINNAGVSHMNIPSEDLDDHRWNISIAVMQTAVFYCMRAAAKPMLKRNSGTIVNIGSVRSFAPKDGGMSYCAPKAAVVMMTHIAASEWGRSGIRVNAVAPGGMLTEMWTEAVASGQLDEAIYLKSIPMGRLGRPEEIATLVRFLASDESSYINGETITIDGGLNSYRAA